MRSTLSRKKNYFMISALESILFLFKPAFHRQATFAWFAIVVIGAIMRTDTFGVSSFIRALALCPLCYPNLLHFFHSVAWNCSDLLLFWWLWIIQQKFVFMVNDRIVLTGDHTKNVKDGRKIPAVETLHQDSETSSKPTYFRGHHWGFIGLLTHVGPKFWSTPLWAEIHRVEFEEKRSTRIVSQALIIAQQTKKKAYLILDAFFSCGPVFTTAAHSTDRTVYILTRAKKNVTAYQPAKKRKKKSPGRKPKYGKKIKLMELFNSSPDSFYSLHTHVYDANETIRYCCIDLLWKPIKETIRFFLIQSSRGKIILMTDDLSMSVDTALMMYCKRSSIETLFNSLKNLFGGLQYHFWSKYLPPCSRRPAKKGTPKPVSLNPEKTRATLDAIEKFVIVLSISLGIVQVMALRFPKEIVTIARCWMRTPPKEIPSEFMTKIAIVNLINANLCSFAKNMITHLILNKQKMPYKSSILSKAG
jgi:hypothetical protein